MKGFVINFIILATILGLTQYYTASEITVRMVVITFAWAVLGAALATYLFRKLGV